MEKLAELLKDKAVAEELMRQETIEDAQKFLASKGVDVTDEDLQAIRAEIQKQTSESDELNDDQLENVAGGVAVSTVIGIVSTVISAVPTVVELFKKIKW